MAQKTRFTPYDEKIVEAFDLDESGSEFTFYLSTPYLSTPSMAWKDGFPPDDPIPFFLSGHAEEPERTGIGKAWARAVVSSRFVKTSILAVTAIAIVFAIPSVGNPFALFANATASLVGVPTSQSDTGPSTPAIQSTAGAQALPQTARDAPTRDEIAAAFKTAHRSQNEIRQPPTAAPPARLIDADELAALLKRAKGLIAIGDIASARLLLERAADAQEASAALLLARTYDPAVLGTPDARSVTPDPDAARGWYQKAARLGSADAQQRLEQMEN